jgi:hypothetical protein
MYDCPYHNPWVSNVKNLLCSLRLNNAWYSQGVYNPSHLFAMVKQKLTDIFILDRKAFFENSSECYIYIKYLIDSFDIQYYLRKSIQENLIHHLEIKIIFTQIDNETRPLYIQVEQNVRDMLETSATITKLKINITSFSNVQSIIIYVVFTSTNTSIKNIYICNCFLLHNTVTSTCIYHLIDTFATCTSQYRSTW